MSARRRPPRLQPGMTLGVVAPSGPVLERSVLHRGVAALEGLGFRVELAPHVRDVYGYLAGRDADRAADLLAMLERDDVDAVICLRGGYGAIRTVMALDRDRLRALATRPPKPFVGYSDITVLHAVLGRELGWTTFYGPMVASFADVSAYTVDGFRRALMATEPFAIPPDPDDPYVETLVPGAAEGALAGGCLSLVVALLGTPWELDLRGTIFCFEDVHEQPYGIDRMLAQLITAGKIQGCAGIVVGEHADCAARGPSSLGLEQVFDDLLRPLGIPTLYHLPIGHGEHLATLPLGARARLDASARTLTVLESGVR
ncbi:MAG TPA: LD-carboxypeptidase [Thermomicrobiales bacterium]|nr:LD-carboxypeptidase [Thermomicrobiales bacterium]